MIQNLEDPKQKIADVGCVLTAYARIASAIIGSDISLAEANKYAVENNLFSGKGKDLLTPEAGAQLINGLISEAGIENVSVELYSSGGNLTGNPEHEMNMFNIMDSSDTEYFATGRINTTNSDGTETYGHHVNLNHNAFTVDPQADNPINLRLNDTSGVRKQMYNDTRTNQLERIDYYKVIRNPVSTEE